MGFTHPDLILECLTTYQLHEWMAYYSVEPFGERRADLRQAITSMVVANTNRSKKQRAFKVKDFMPFDKPKKSKQQTQEQMIAQLNLLC